MKPQSLRYVVWAAVAVGALLMAATPCLVAWTRAGHTSPAVPAIATGLMIATLALQLLCLVVQLFPNGRDFVPVLDGRTDGLHLAMIATMTPGALWPLLRHLAGQPMDSIMPGFYTPAFNALFLFVSRSFQLRNRGVASMSSTQTQ